MEATEKRQVRNGGHFVTRKFQTFTSHLEKKTEGKVFSMLN